MDSRTACKFDKTNTLILIYAGNGWHLWIMGNTVRLNNLLLCIKIYIVAFPQKGRYRHFSNFPANFFFIAEIERSCHKLSYDVFTILNLRVMTLFR